MEEQCNSPTAPFTRAGRHEARRRPNFLDSPTFGFILVIDRQRLPQVPDRGDGRCPAI